MVTLAQAQPSSRPSRTMARLVFVLMRPHSPPTMLRLLPLWASLALWAACVWQPTPAPCVDDVNCPDALRCVNGSCLVERATGEGEGEEGEGEEGEGEGEGEGEDCVTLAALLIDAPGDTDLLASFACVRVTGDLVVTAFFGASVAGLAPVIEVGGSLRVEDNNGLLRLDGLEGVRRIGGDLVITGNSLLADVTALHGAQLDGDLQVTANSLLRTCNAQALETALRVEGFTGTAEIDGNFPDACGN